MAHTYTIELSDVEQKAMEYIAVDIDQWVQNAIHERARLAIEEMVRDDISYRMQNGLTISGTRDEMVLASTLPVAPARNAAIIAAAHATMNGQ